MSGAGQKPPSCFTTATAGLALIADAAGAFLWPNVGRAINYYQAGGWGSPLTPEAGFRGKLANCDLSGDRTIFHFNIDKSDRIQAEILREIQEFQHLEARQAR
jgi:hypothetical protein